MNFLFEAHNLCELKNQFLNQELIRSSDAGNKIAW